MRDDRFATTSGRLDHETELDGHLAELTRESEAHELMEKLQRGGVEACAVQDFRDLQSDPQLESREHFVEIEHAVLGELRFERSGFRLSQNPGALRWAGPTLGQHNREVLHGLLGFSDDEIAGLVQAGVVA
jgi:formyl-CoA transferase